MLPKERALYWYQCIVDNEKSGNYEQKVLGLRRIFNGVLLEMFPNVSEQAFYCVCIDQIFEIKKSRCEFHPSFAKKQREYHKLRLYFNNLMHSKIEADEKGYLTATRSLSSLIKFCSQIDVPTGVSTIYANIDKQTPRLNQIKHKEKLSQEDVTSEVKTTSKEAMPSTLSIIVDRRNDLPDAQLFEIEKGIKAVINNSTTKNFNFVVFTIKKDSSVLAFPISGKKTRFSFNGTSEDEQIKPLRDYLVNINPEVQYHFLLTKASAENKFRIPVSLNNSSFLMSIGIIEKSDNNKLSDSRNSSNFDKLILSSNLSSFFDWIGKIINND